MRKVLNFDEADVLVFFFFQAEDGIRDFHVTGVQTCALPIYADVRPAIVSMRSTGPHDEDRGRERQLQTHSLILRGRSEERRVGKECRLRGSPYHSKKNLKLALS